jgi:Protein of unknown function (DUF3088)
MKDQLYLLRPGFMNAGMGPLYCSDSAPVEGVLSFFPQLRELVDIHYLEFPRPREPLVKALGDQNQSLPVLILAANRKINDAELEPRSANGRWFFADQSSIRHYLSTQYNLPQASE